MVKTSLERATVVLVDLMLDQPNVWILAHDIGRAVFAAIVHDDEFEAIDPDLL